MLRPGFLGPVVISDHEGFREHVKIRMVQWLHDFTLGTVTNVGP